MGELTRQFMAKLSLECWQEPVYKKIFLFFAAIWIIRDCFKLEFPDHYLWAETFINYEGGFMRRGLWGQLLYYLAPWTGARIMALGACAAAFLLFLKLAYDRFSVAFDKLTTIIVFITPAYFLFFIKDYVAFLRKDQFINLLAIATVIATARCLRQNRPPLVAPTLIFLACFAGAWLIHEATVFYFTLPAWLLGLAWSKRQKTWLWLLLMAVAFLAAGYAATQLAGTAENARAIAAAWQKIYPNFPGHGALDYLGMPISELRAETAQYQHNAVAVRSAVWGLFLALLPMAWICAAYRPFAAMRANFSIFMCCLLPCAAACPWALPVFACDFGRHIALASVQYILALWAVVDILKLQPQPWLDDLLAKIDTSAKIRIWVLAIVILYGTSWTLMPWVKVGHSFVILAGIPDLIVYMLTS